MKRCFDLILANPPYGSHGGLARKINTRIRSFANICVIVSIPQGFSEVVPFISQVANVETGTFEEMFIRTMICKLADESNIFKSLTDARCRLDMKMFEYKRCLEKYNSTHEARFEWLGAIGNDINRPRFEGKDCSLIFAIAWFSSAPNHRVSSPIHLKSVDAKINLLGNGKIDFDNIGTVRGILFKDRKQLEGFSRVWYGFNCRPNGWESIADQKGTLIDFILNCIYLTEGSYEDWFPNINWNKEWTDETILEEIGLPKDFLKSY